MLQFKRSLSFWLALCLVIAVIPIESLKVSASGNNIGTMVEGFLAVIDDSDASAIRITNAEELNNVRNDLYGSFVLMNDIDLSKYSNWTPIGTSVETAFHGKFDGQGHQITGLNINANMNSGSLTGQYAVGLFGVSSGAEIKNVRLENVNVSVSTTSGYGYANQAISSTYSVYAGALIGYATNDADSNTVIYNCSASGGVSAKASGEGYSDTFAGGLVGYMNATVISYSYNNCNVQAYNGNSVQAYNAYAGGLFGGASQTNVIDKSYNSGAVSAQTLDYGNAYAGGVSAIVQVGLCNITNCFNEGAVYAQSGNMFCEDAYAGGITASFAGTINSVYDSGIVNAKVVDKYGIGGGKAHAGGINAVSTSQSSIINSAVVQSAVEAISNSKTLYRISNGGTKTNNITCSSMAGGSTNDATSVVSDVELKSEVPYTNILGWNFESVWEMVSGKDFPRLMSMDVESDEYQSDYIAKHLAFIDGTTYTNFLANERWAKIYWSQENNLVSNTGELLYNGIDNTLDFFDHFFDGEFKEAFESKNPYEILLANYIAKQSAGMIYQQEFDVIFAKELKDNATTIIDYIKEEWEENWDKLSDEDLFYLFEYDKRPSEGWITNHFEDYLIEIVQDTRDSGKPLEKFFDYTNLILDTGFDIIEWINEQNAYVAHVEAFVKTSNQFKELLRRLPDNMPVSTLEEKRNKNLLSEVVEDYLRYNSEENLRQFAKEQFMQKKGSINDILVRNCYSQMAEGWLKKSYPAVYKIWLKAKVAVTAGKITWGIMDYITKNGEIAECRQMLRTNAYFEMVVFNTLKEAEKDFLSDSSIEKALFFDTTFKLLKEIELNSIDICIQYCEAYHASWVRAIDKSAQNFKKSFIEEHSCNSEIMPIE